MLRFAALATVLLVACSGNGSSSSTDGGDGPRMDFDGGSRLEGGPLHPAAACPVTVDAPELLGAAHVDVGSFVAYDSNPPSSGPHYPVWAAYKEWDHAFPRPYYVHDLEHGAIVFLYNCGTDAGCTDVVATLRKAMNALPDDPLCAGSSVRVRALIAPDPNLDVPIAAAAWGWIYRAQCADLPTLTDFALQHYAQGPEALCSDGTDQL